MKEKQAWTLRFRLGVWVTEHVFVGRFHTFLQGTQPLRVSRDIGLLFVGPWHTRWGWGVSPTPHAPRPTPRPPLPPGKDPVPFVQEAPWAPGPVWTGGKSRPHRHSIPNRPARSSVAIPTELPGPPCSCICVYINVVANSAVLDILTACFYNLIFRIKYKLFISSGSASPSPPLPSASEKFCTAPHV